MNNILNRINRNVEKKTEKSIYDIDNLKKVKQDGLFVLTLDKKKTQHRIFRG